MKLGSELVLVHAPFGRDAQLIRRVLESDGIGVEVCHTFTDLCHGVPKDAGAVLIADEALSQTRVSELAQLLDAQPAWSDLAVLIMTSGGQTTVRSQARLQLLKPLEGTMVLLERPLRTATLLTYVSGALRARRRQYQVRELLEREAESSASLSAANSALQRTNEDLAQFAYSVSHDLQEPLRTISAYTQLLARRYKGTLDEEGDEWVAYVLDGSLRMKTLIRDLLEFAQATEKITDLNPECDSLAALKEATENLQLLIEETAATFSMGPLPSVAVDHSQLTRLFQNLIGNALKYRKLTEPPLVRITASRSGVAYWEFSIGDNGIGFDPRYAADLFGVFKRLHGREIPGTGIGLAVCKRIVEHYGGSLWAQGQPGEGATFSFTLPGCPSFLAK